MPTNKYFATPCSQFHTQTKTIFAKVKLKPLQK